MRCLGGARKIATLTLVSGCSYARRHLDVLRRGPPIAVPFGGTRSGSTAPAPRGTLITWPASLALILVLLVWFFTRNSDSPIRRSICEAALPVLIGVGLFWIVSLVVALPPKLTDNRNQWLFEAEKTLLYAQSAVHALSGPKLTDYLLILGLLLMLLCFFPESRAIGRLIRTKKQLARLHLCLLALTSFTFFGTRSADERAQKDYEKGLQEIEIILRTELEAAKNSLPTMLANESVIEMLETPISKPEKIRCYLVIPEEPASVRPICLPMSVSSNLFGKSCGNVQFLKR